MTVGERFGSDLHIRRGCPKHDPLSGILPKGIAEVQKPYLLRLGLAAEG